jgi:hypothetical protein
LKHSKSFLAGRGQNTPPPQIAYLVDLLLVAAPSGLYIFIIFSRNTRRATLKSATDRTQKQLARVAIYLVENLRFAKK